MSHPNAEVKWIQTVSGLRVNPRSMTVGDIRMVDIAHALSMQCRYAGHCYKFYSVAEHCVLTSWVLEQMGRGPRVQLYGLLHDAEEAYLPDLPRPIKEMFPEYREAGKYIMDLVIGKYNLPWGCKDEIKKVDNALLHTEALEIMGDTSGWYLPEPPVPDLLIQGWEPHKAKTKFLHRFNQLRDDIFPNG